MCRLKDEGNAFISGRAPWLLLLAAFASNNAFAVWSDDFSPMGPTLNYFDIHFAGGPTTIYATSQTGGNDGVWKFTGSWTQQDSGNAYTSIAVDPTNANNAVAGINGGGIKFTNNGGSNWIDSTGESSHASRVFAYSASNPDVVYAGGQTVPSGEFLRSTDGGQTWVSKSVQGDVAPEVISIAVDPTNPAIVFASMKLDNNNKGIFKSTDGGDNWSFKSGYSPTTAFAIAIDPNDTGIIYAGTDGNPQIYRSTDGGNTWQNIHSPFVSQFGSVDTIAIHPADSRVIYAGGNSVNQHVIASTDCGSTWNAVNDSNKIFGGPKKLAHDGGTIYAVGFSGSITSETTLSGSGSCPVSSSDSGGGGGGGGGSSGGPFGPVLAALMLLLVVLRRVLPKRRHI